MASLRSGLAVGFVMCSAVQCSSLQEPVQESGSQELAGLLYRPSTCKFVWSGRATQFCVRCVGVYSNSV